MTTDLNLIGYRLAAAPPETIDRKPLALLAPLSTVHSNGGYFGRKWGVGRYVEAFAPGTTGVTFSRCTARKTRVVDVKQNHEPRYLICKSGAFYRPGAAGYTRDKSQAGRFTLAEAMAYTFPNGPFGPRDGITFVEAADEPKAERGAVRYPLDMGQKSPEPCAECARLSARLREAELLLIEARPAVALVQSLAERPLTRDRAGIVMTRARSALAQGEADAAKAAK